MTESGVRVLLEAVGRLEGCVKFLQIEIGGGAEAEAEAEAAFERCKVYLNWLNLDGIELKRELKDSSEFSNKEKNILVRVKVFHESRREGCALK